MAEGIESEFLVDENLFSSLDHLLAIDLLRVNLQRLKDRIEGVQKISGSRTIVDDESGHTQNRHKHHEMCSFYQKAFHSATTLTMTKYDQS